MPESAEPGSSVFAWTRKRERPERTACGAVRALRLRRCAPPLRMTHYASTRSSIETL